MMYKIGLIVWCVAGLFSCGKSGIEKFEGKNYIYFAERFDKDSVDVSFYFHPGAKELKIPLHLKISGDVLTTDKEFSLIADEASTAELSDYTLPRLRWKTGVVEDSSFQLVLHYSPKLETEVVRLILRVVENDNFIPGDTRYRKMLIRFSALKSKPLWWDDKITNEYLGLYTEKKLDVFMEMTGVGDLSGKSEDEIRSLSVQFKYKLIEEAENGNIIRDENGPMYKTITVSV